jgi:hypothetical protein
MRFAGRPFENRRSSTSFLFEIVESHQLKIFVSLGIHKAVVPTKERVQHRAT